MTVVFLALLVLGDPAAPPEPGTLVGQLNSSRAAERAAAAAALERMGPEAVPALREARQSRDLELRARAAALLDAIEGRTLTLPTLVTLDFRDRPIVEVVAAIAERSKIPLVLEPEGDHRWRLKRITLESPAPLPFWEALERLCKPAGLRLLTGPEETGFRGVNRFGIAGGLQPRMRSGQELILLPNDPGGAAPVVSSGAVQVTLLALHHQRDRVFFANSEASTAPSESVRFTARLQVRVEPRLTLAWVGSPREFEAIDDRGQWLPRESFPITPRPPSPFNNGVGTRPGLLEIAMRYPERPGKTIERLRGTIPVVIAGRRAEPLVAPLEGSSDQVFRVGDTTLVIHDVKALPEQRGTAIELTLTIPELASPTTTQPWATRARSGPRLPSLSQPQLDFVDAEGRVCQSFGLGPDRLGDGTRKTITVQPSPGTGPPVEVRYHELTWATVAVPFAFEDLPMP